MTIDGPHRMDVSRAEAFLPELIEQVEGGGEIVITHAGRAVATLVPWREGFQKPRTWEGKIWLEPEVERVHGELFYASAEASTALG